MSKRIAAIAAGVAILATGLTFAPGSPGSQRTAKPEVSKLLAQNFAIFRRDYAVRPSLLARIADVIEPRRRATGAQGRLLSFDNTELPSGGQLVVLPRGNRICLSTSAGGMSCLEDDLVARGFLNLGQLCKVGLPPGHARVAGLVPDGVRSVTLKTAQGAITANVKDNAYVFETTGRPLAVRWRARDGEHGFPTPLPDPASIACASEPDPRDQETRDRR